MIFPNFLCGHCKEQAICIKVDPPINGRDSKCSKCGDLHNNYYIKNGELIVWPYDDLLAVAKKQKQ